MRVLAFGTFDLLHKGHESFLRDAKVIGDSLYVVVATDNNVLRIKGRSPAQDEDTRLANVRALSYIDAASLGREDFDYMKIIRSVRPGIICLGYDQQTFDLEEQITGLDIKVIRLKPFRPSTFKSSILRASAGSDRKTYIASRKAQAARDGYSDDHKEGMPDLRQRHQGKL
jgi:FAD synthetase